MTRRMLMALALGTLVGTSPLGARAQAGPAAPGVVEVMAETASTPAQHQALAEHYRAQAEESRRLAAEHRSMARTYRGSLKETVARVQRKHCERLVELNEEQAKAYDELAKNHEEAAKQ